MSGASIAAAHKASADKLFKEGFLDEAICAYDLALAVADDDAARTAILCNRSAVLLKDNKCKEATSDAARAVALDPANVKPRYRQACALSALGKTREAMAACDAGIKLAPDNAQLQALRSRCEQELAEEAAAAVATGAPSPASADTEATAESEPSEEPPEDDAEYATWCQATANRLFGQREYGQACAWYTHAITALDQLADAAESERTATLLSNRAATMLRLGRWKEAAVDCRRAISLDTKQLKAYARGSAALMRLGATAESVAMAEAALAASVPSPEAAEERRAELLALPTRDLRERLRDLRRASQKRADEIARAERGDGGKGKHAARRHGGKAPCLAATATPASGGAEGEGAAPIEKGEMVSEVMALLDEEERDSPLGSAYHLASQAHAEAVAMRARVDEIGWMAVKGEWAATREHSEWLASEYPQHAALRALRLDAILALRDYTAADALLDEQLHHAPDAPELLYSSAVLEYIRHGPEAAKAYISVEVPLDEPCQQRSAELHGLLLAQLALAEESRAALLKGDAATAADSACAALSLAQESPAARHSMCLLLARCLARGSRHVETVKACDAGLAAAAEARAACGGVGNDGVAGAPSDHERLLLRRASSFLTIGQYAEAVADYRAAARLNPTSSHAAAGLQEAWRSLKVHQKVDSLYAVLGVASDATADELKKAYRKEALRWHPDKHAHAEESKQVEAENRFKELAAAWAVLSDEATRAAYDDDLARNGGAEDVS